MSRLSHLPLLTAFVVGCAAAAAAYGAMTGRQEATLPSIASAAQ